LTNVNPNLGMLIGSPAYHHLLAGSPAINAGNPSGCQGSTGLLTTDQRGAARVGRCDIGAYEYTTPGAAANISVYSGTPQRSAPSVPFSMPFQALVTDSIGSPVSNAIVTFSSPASGASGIFVDTGTRTTTATTNQSGIATSALLTANAALGSYIVQASVSGVDSSGNFQLTNFGWYVATNGLDAHDCQTPSTPCATINGVLSKPGFLPGDTILVGAGTYFGGGSEVVLLDRNVRLEGGWNSSFTSQTGVSAIDASYMRRGITINGGVSATINRFVVQNGSSGILNDGSLTLNNSTIANNSIGFYLEGGGGILNRGTLTVNNSTISSNISRFGSGIYNQGTVNLNNTTISFNQTYDPSGSALSGSALEGGTINLRNTIVAKNSTDRSLSLYPAPDCGSATIVSGGYNIIGNTSNCGFQPTSGDITNVDPKLGPLQANDSPALTHAPLFSSPAINAGNPAGCSGSAGMLTTDQRGFPRVGRCDIGAVETQPLELSAKVVNNSSVSNGGTATFSLGIRNNGISNLTNVRVTDTLPIQLTYISNSLSATSGTPNISNGVITWMGSVNVGGVVTITFGARVNQGTHAGTTITNSTLIDGGGIIVTRSAAVNVDGMVCNLIKNPTNPVLLPGSSGSWDSAQVWDPTVLKDGNTYKMWYTGRDGNGITAIGYATSSDGITWTKYNGNPVIPSDFFFAWNQISSPTVIKENGLYRMWLSSRDTYLDKTHIMYASSTDGLTWTPYTYASVLSPGYAENWDGTSVSNPTILKIGYTYHMWYTGGNGATNLIGHATSSNGIVWIKDSGNPTLNFVPGGWDWLQLYNPSIVSYGTQYFLWYSGKTLPLAFRTGYASSSNLTSWTRQGVVLSQGFSGAFDSNAADYASVMVDGNGF
ncbi:hypothetical protein ANRL1_04350, partial [Anaerolineae bacterium]